MHEGYGVIAWREAFDFEFAVRTTDRVERIFYDVDEHTHPGMLVALYGQQNFFAGEGLFDGRSLPNPGREERFKALTGKDTPVIEYLNQQESVHQFLASVMSLVDASVNSYRERGFKNLMVSFGCTGGQHRSVYLAEQLAKHFRARNGVEVAVRHLQLEKMGR